MECLFKFQIFIGQVTVHDGFCMCVFLITGTRGRRSRIAKAASSAWSRRLSFQPSPIISKTNLHTLWILWWLFILLSDWVGQIETVYKSIAFYELPGHVLYSFASVTFLSSVAVVVCVGSLVLIEFWKNCIWRITFMFDLDWYIYHTTKLWINSVCRTKQVLYNFVFKSNRNIII